jgi:hypothetical protein
MDAAHHLTRKEIEGRGIKLEQRKQDADGIGQTSPCAGAETFRKTMLEIAEPDLDGAFRRLSLLHGRVPLAFPAAAYRTCLIRHGRPGHDR